MSVTQSSDLNTLIEKRRRLRSSVEKLVSRINRTIAHGSKNQIEALRASLVRRDTDLCDYDMAINERLSQNEAQIDKEYSTNYALLLRGDIKKLTNSIHDRMETSSETKILEGLYEIPYEHNFIRISGSNGHLNSRGTVPSTYKKNMIENDFEDLPPQENPNIFGVATEAAMNASGKFLKKHKGIIKIMVGIILEILYFVYFGYAMYRERLETGDSKQLLCITCIKVYFVVAYLVKQFWGKTISSFWQTKVTKELKNWNRKEHGKPHKILSTVTISLAVIICFGMSIFITIKTGKHQNWICLSGISFLLLLAYIGSNNPTRVQWRPVCVGLLLQLMLAQITLKTLFGYKFFSTIANQVGALLSNAKAGIDFLFLSQDVELNSFTFNILPPLIFFSAFVSALYYIGIMQYFSQKLSFVMEVLMGTTTTENISTTGNMFIGMTNSIIMIRPMLQLMTNSELHAVMTGGFATIAGSILIIQSDYGIPANHILTASVMSAPAALAISKLMYPETKISLTKSKMLSKMEKSSSLNIMDAVYEGAVSCISIIGNIIVLSMAFISVMAFFNSTLTWFGARVELVEDLTCPLIASYILFPFPLLMGVPLKDCRRVAKLIGLKIFANELVAYQELGEIMRNRKSYESFVASMNITNPTINVVANNIVLPQFNKTFKKGFMASERTEVISIYSICGFGNISAIAMLMGTLSGMILYRMNEITTFVIRALVAGNIACLLSACIAGLYFEPTATSASQYTQ